ncbi:hypothetical protein SDC9_119776 [bioreactor metagenome]|uniref:Uncharacterized protein n=1 Tax=bioreactor metagenome TaxID=1076179 RepID=A0A645C4V8_9ZZZZ
MLMTHAVADEIEQIFPGVRMRYRRRRGVRYSSRLNRRLRSDNRRRNHRLDLRFGRRRQHRTDASGGGQRHRYPGENARRHPQEMHFHLLTLPSPAAVQTPHRR